MSNAVMIVVCLLFYLFYFLSSGGWVCRYFSILYSSTIEVDRVTKGFIHPLIPGIYCSIVGRYFVHYQVCMYAVLYPKRFNYG